MHTIKIFFIHFGYYSELRDLNGNSKNRITLVPIIKFKNQRNLWKGLSPLKQTCLVHAYCLFRWMTGGCVCWIWIHFGSRKSYSLSFAQNFLHKKFFEFIFYLKLYFKNFQMCFSFNFQNSIYHNLLYNTI